MVRNLYELNLGLSKNKLAMADKTESLYILRRTEAADYLNLNAAYNSFTGRARSLEQYAWQWVATPFAASESWVIEYSPTKEIIGHHGVMYLPFTENGQAIAVGKTENTFVDAAHRTKFFYAAQERKALQAMEDRFKYIFTTFPVDGLILIRKRLGYKSVGKIVSYHLNFSAERLKNSFNNRYPALSWLPVASCCYLAQCFVHKIFFPETKDVWITPLNWSEVEEISYFWKQNKSCYGITPDRTSAYLTWRFAKNPNKDYDLLRLSLDQKVIGYAIINRQENSKENFIEDLIVLQGKEQYFYLALAALVNRFENQTLNIMILLQDDPLNCAINRLLKFLKRWLIILGTDLLVWGANESSAKWYFTRMMGEGLF
jgi:hypothetical protein